jgi:hypothetical protein
MNRNAKKVILGTTTTVNFTVTEKARIEDEVLKTWESRRLAQGYKKEHKRTKELQCEFMLGMVAAMDAISHSHERNETTMSLRVMFGIMRGEYLE